MATLPSKSCAAGVCNTGMLASINHTTNMFCNCRASNMCTARRRTSRTKLALMTTANRIAPFKTNSVGFISRITSNTVGRGSVIIVNSPGPSICNGLCSGLSCGHFALGVGFGCSCNGSVCGCRHTRLRNNSRFFGRAATLGHH